jgi:predicted HicB family RNase H-like nuclease
MSTLSIRIPKSLHDDAREAARKEDVSLNQFIAITLAEKVSAIKTSDYLEERARRGSLEDFQRIMGKIPHVEPEAHDRL